MKRNKNRDRLVCGFLSLILAAGMTQGCASPHVSDQSNHNSQETGEDQTPSYSYEDTDKAESSPAPAETNASSERERKKHRMMKRYRIMRRRRMTLQKTKPVRKRILLTHLRRKKRPKKIIRKKPLQRRKQQPLKLSLLTQIKKRKASLTGPTRIPTMKSLRPLIRIAKTGRIPTKQRLRKRILKKEIITTRTDLSNMNIRRKKTPVRI